MKMTPLDRMTFELVEAGMVTEVRRPLYEPSISRLIEAGIVIQRGSSFEPVDADRVGRRPDGSSRLTPPKPERPPALKYIQVRVPQPWIDALVERGPDISSAARDILGPALEGKAYKPGKYGPPKQATPPPSSESGLRGAVRGARRTG